MVLAEPCIFYACKNDQCTNFVQLTTFFTVSPDKVMSYKIFANSSPQVELMAVLIGYTPPWCLYRWEEGLRLILFMDMELTILLYSYSIAHHYNLLHVWFKIKLH